MCLYVEPSKDYVRSWIQTLFVLRLYTPVSPNVPQMESIIIRRPPKMLPTKLLITCTCFQRITSYLVHTNFSSCMIILQSFQFVSQVVRLLCSPQNVFQMSPLALQAHFPGAHKIVNDTNTFFCGDCPDHGCNCCVQVNDCLGVVFIHSVLEITPKVQICGC